MTFFRMYGLKFLNSMMYNEDVKNGRAHCDKK